MPKQGLRWLLCCTCLLVSTTARADITEVLNTPQAGSPALAGLATAVFHGIISQYPDNTPAILAETQGLSILPYYAFQDANINARLLATNNFYYYPTDSGGTTASFFQSDAAGAVLADTSQWVNSGADFVGYINFPATGSYTINIDYADDALAIFLDGNGTPGSGDFVATQSWFNQFPTGNAGITQTAYVTVNTAGWYPFEMAYFQGCCGTNMSVTITGPSVVQFGSDFNHWTAFVPAFPLNVTPAQSYSGPPGLAAAVWHQVTDYGDSLASVDDRIAYGNATSPNYVFLDINADTNFFLYNLIDYTSPSPYDVPAFVYNGASGLALNDQTDFDFTMIDFVGWMYVSQTGTYWFNLQGDDSAVFLIGGTGPIGSGTEWIRVSNQGVATYNPKISIVQAGWYPIEILYNQGSGGSTLALSYTGPASIRLAADFNRWNNSVAGLTPTSADPWTGSAWVSGFAASVYHLANTFGAGDPLDASILPVLQAGIAETAPNYRFYTGAMSDPNALNYRGNEAQATNTVLGAYAQGAAASDTTDIGSTIIDHIGWVYFAKAGWQWIFFDAATDFGAIYLGGNGSPNTGELLLSGSFNDAPGVGAWGRVNIATPGWYPIEVLWFSRYDCGAACNANLILSAWGPGAVTFAAAPVNDITPPAPGGLLATVYRLGTSLPAASDAYTVARVISEMRGLEPNYTYLDTQAASSFNLSGTDTTALNTFLGVHAGGLASADGNALGATIIDWTGAMVFSQAGNYTIALTAADDAAVLFLGREPNTPAGEIVMERNLTNSITSPGGLTSPLTLQVTEPGSHPFELIWYNSDNSASTGLAALGLSVTGPATVNFAAPLNAAAGVSVCGDFNAYIPATASTVDVANYGAAPNDGNDDYAGIQAAVTALGSGQTLLFHPGNYNILYGEMGTIATLNGLADVEIDGNGANLLISGYNIDTPATSGAFFKITNSDHITIHDFSIDMPRPPYSHGLVTSYAGSNGLNVTFDATPAVDAGMLIAAITEYDENSLPLAQNLDDYYFDNTGLFSVTQNSAQHLAITMTARSNPGAETGEYVMVRHAFREQPAISALNSNYISIGNMNIYAAPGDGIQANMINVLYIQNLNVRNGTGRYMSVTGHGIEAHGSTGGITVCGSSLEGMGGDGILTTGQPGTVAAVSGSSITVNTNSAFGVAPFRVGDEIRVYSATGAIRGSAVATSASVISDASTSNTLKFKFLPYGTVAGDTVTAYNRDTNINIRYSAVTHNSGRGIALANGGVVVDHTQIQGCTGHGLHCYADLQTAAPACDRVLLTNNNFHDVGNANAWAAASFQTFCGNAVCPNQLTKNISLVNNAFDYIGARAVEFASVYGINMQYNALNYIANTQPSNSISAVDIRTGTLGVISNNSLKNSQTLAVSQSGDTNVTVSNNTGTW